MTIVSLNQSSKELRQELEEILASNNAVLYLEDIAAIRKELSARGLDYESEEI